MLTEITSTSRNYTEKQQRWFQDGQFDLFVFQDKTEGHITSFQLCYDRNKCERVILWDVNEGFSHLRVDDGEASPCKNMSPVMIACNSPLRPKLIELFQSSAQHIPNDIRTTVLKKLHEYQSG